MAVCKQARLVGQCARYCCPQDRRLQPSSPATCTGSLEGVPSLRIQCDMGDATHLQNIRVEQNSQSQLVQCVRGENAMNQVGRRTRCADVCTTTCGNEVRISPKGRLGPFKHRGCKYSTSGHDYPQGLERAELEWIQAFPVYFRKESRACAKQGHPS